MSLGRAGTPAARSGGETLGTLSKLLRLELIRLPGVNFPQNETLRMYVGCIQP